MCRRTGLFAAAGGIATPSNPDRQYLCGKRADPPSGQRYRERRVPSALNWAVASICRNALPILPRTAPLASGVPSGTGLSVIADLTSTSSTNSGGTTIQPTVFGLTWAFEVRLRNPGQLQPALIGHQPSQCCRPARVLRNEWAPPRAMQGWAAEAHCDVSAWPAGTRTGAMSQSGRVSAGGRLRGGPPDRLRDHRPQPRGSALAGRPHRRGGPASHRSRGRSHGQGRIQRAVPSVSAEAPGSVKTDVEQSRVRARR
jgi:hypothetical protein